MSARRGAAAAALCLSLLFAGCAAPRSSSVAPVSGGAPPPVSAAPPVAPALDSGAANAVAAGVSPGSPIDALPIDPARAASALSAFRLSCPGLVRRTDLSGLAPAAAWGEACAAATDWPAGQAAGFFARYFETARVGEGRLFATGYYEPETSGSRVPALGYDVPVYGVPDDLVEADLGRFAPDLAGRKIRGRIEGNRLVPYPDRGQIEDGAIRAHAPVIGWAADPIAMFFVQVQGSGRLRLPDGSVMRIGYAGQNGQPYTGIGKWMLGQGLLQPGQASMQGIVGWLHAHPEQADAVMRQNRSFVFFRELTGAGPLGAMGVPVAPRTSVAVDPRFVPLGAPVWLAPDRAEAAGLWIAQDTGGAIKGANRVDTFWGAGADAARIAGGMATRGAMLLLVPRGTLARLNAHEAATPRS